MNLILNTYPNLINFLRVAALLKGSVSQHKVFFPAPRHFLPLRFVRFNQVLRKTCSSNRDGDNREMNGVRGDGDARGKRVDEMMGWGMGHGTGGAGLRRVGTIASWA